MALSFARLWKNEEHSDVDVVFKVTSHSGDETAAQQLSHFPGHSVLLSSSPMISAQILRWQHHEKAADEPPPKRRRTRSSTAGTSKTEGSSSSRPQLVLELQDVSEEAAALVVLQSLYAVAPLHKLLASLHQEQLLQAAVLADKWQLSDVSTAAVQMLQASTLSRKLLQHFVQPPAVPTLLLPLLDPVVSACMRDKGPGKGMAGDAKRLLLSVLGDLEGVMGDAALREALFTLPLHAMELLLSSDDLKVASEDTVLAAVRAYVNADKSTSTAVNLILAPHVRCQHLSMFWLSACVHAKDKALSAVFSPFKKQLKKLLMMRLADNDFVTKDELQLHLTTAPPSWRLGMRDVRDVHSVQLVWPLRISTLRSAAQRASSRQDLVEVKYAGVSAPMGGMTWSMLVQAVWDSDRQATRLGLFCIPHNAPRNCWYRFRGRVDVAGAQELSFIVDCSCLLTGSKGGRQEGWGQDDFFDVGWMSGGWDEAVWVAGGLPAAGELRVTLTVTGANSAGSMEEDSDAD